MRIAAARDQIVQWTAAFWPAREGRCSRISSAQVSRWSDAPASLLKIAIPLIDRTRVQAVDDHQGWTSARRGRRSDARCEVPGDDVSADDDDGSVEGRRLFAEQQIVSMRVGQPATIDLDRAKLPRPSTPSTGRRDQRQGDRSLASADGLARSSAKVGSRRRASTKSRRKRVTFTAATRCPT